MSYRAGLMDREIIDQRKRKHNAAWYDGDKEKEREKEQMPLLANA